MLLYDVSVSKTTDKSYKNSFSILMVKMTAIVSFPGTLPRCIQHILNKNPITLCGVIDQHMGHRAH